MPKVPASSKRARSVLNSAPLIPPSLQSEVTLQHSKVSAPATRSSSRLAVRPGLSSDLNKGLEPAIKLEPDLSQAENVDDVKEKTGRPQAKRKRKVEEGDEAIDKAPIAVSVKNAKSKGSKVAAVAASDKPAGKGRTKKAAKDPAMPIVKEEEDAEDVAPKKRKGRAKSQKVKEEEPDQEHHKEDDGVKAKANASAKRSKKAKKTEGPATATLLEADLLDREESADEVAQDVVKAKKKSNRRGPVGFALRGENVEDTPASRRVRLKAAMIAGKKDVLEAPVVLDTEVAQMCKDLDNDRLGMTGPWHKDGPLVGNLRWWTGCHCSTAGGLERAVINAAATGCRAFAMDVRCKVRWESPPLTDETVAAFKDACRKFGYGPEQILPHGSYLINLASPDPEMAKKGYGGFLTELQRCERLGLKMYNFHPGSTTGLCTHEESMDRIAGFINDAHQATKEVIVVLENMSSVNNIVGGKMWHLKYIIDRVHNKDRVGICIDTCHLFSAGVDLRTKADCEAAFRHIDEVVGLKYLKGLHVNDSKTPFDSHRDRHENIGRGSLPMECFKWIMTNPLFQGIPLIMETPVQEREAPVDFKRSLEHGKVWWKDPAGPYGVGTDRRDIILLNSLIEKQSWD